MKATFLFRAAAVLFVLFAAGHTAGFLTFQPPSAEGRAVFADMNRVHFIIGSSTYSYGNFYKGFGLFITVFDLFTAYLAWYLGSLARRHEARIVAAIAWPLAGLQLVGFVLSWLYFGTGPMIFSALGAAILAGGTVLTKTEPLPS